MLKVASAQYPITYHRSFAHWKSHVRMWVRMAIENNANLLLFPEYGAMELVSIFSGDIQRDLHRQVRDLDEIKDDFCRVFQDLATEYSAIIIAPSIPVLHHNLPVNRAFVCSPTGVVAYQDKFFMTRFEGEEWQVTGGEKILTLFDTHWGKFGIQICYDVEFPVGSALLAEAGAHLVLAPSCTETLRGATRVHVGARARALENQLYTVVSQTVGNATWSPAVDINYGFAAAYCPPDLNLPEDGIVFSGVPQNEGWLYFEPDFRLLKEVRINGQVLNYQDMRKPENSFTSSGFEVKIASV